MSLIFPSGYNRYVYIAAITCALGGLLFGYDTGIISGALLFIKKDLGLSAFLQSAVVSAILVGAIVGAGTSGPLADRFGRRKMTIVAAVVFIIGALGSAFAPNVTLLIVARVILGLSVGSSTIFVPACISELAPTELRGTLTSLFQLAITVGIVVAYLVNYALSGAAAWRWMLGLGVVPAVILLVGMLPLPESPRWLVGQDRKDEARAVLGRVREDETRINEEMEEMEEAERREEAGWRELLQPWVRPMLVVGIGLAMGQQLVGINTIIYYAPTIPSSTGLAASSSILATLVVGIVNVVFTIVSLVIIDRVGRRPLLLTGLVGIIIALGVLGVGYLPSLSGATTWITFAGLILYIASFAVSYGVVLWVVLPEIFPLRIRGSGMSVHHIALEFQPGGLPVVPSSYPGDRGDRDVLDLRRDRHRGLYLRLLTDARDQGTQPRADRGRPARQSELPNMKEVRALSQPNPYALRRISKEAW